MFKRFTSLYLLLFIFLPADIFSKNTELLSDTLLSFYIQNQVIRFTADGDLVDIGLSYNYYDVVRIDKKLQVQNGGVPLIRMEPGKELFSDSNDKLSPYILHQSESDTTVSLSFFSPPLASGAQVVKEYSFHKNNYSLVFSGRFIGENKEAVPTKNLSKLQVTFPDSIRDGEDLVIFGKKIRTLGLKKAPDTDTLKEKHWTGIHNRFWGCFVQSAGKSLSLSHKDGAFIIEGPSDASQSFSLKVYYGPIVYKELKKTDPQLGRLLYRLPSWIRWLSFGFLLVFDFLLRILHSVPISLILLSVCVKIVLAPLFKIADRWQKEVNRQSSLIQPHLDEIKRKYKGEEQTRKTLEAYKELGISPLYSLKSLLSAAIQIPVFFAAYDMLSEHIVLSCSSFLWIKDLSYPDQLFKFPFSIPFFGEYFNILPFIMTSFTIGASWIHADSSLSRSLQKKQRKNLYWMAALFFLLLYRSPAGMVIYWTMNNILAFLSTVFEVTMQKFGKGKDKPSQPVISAGN
jgi:YidC/Oxa1 family membrane protein insertase